MNRLSAPSAARWMLFGFLATLALILLSACVAGVRGAVKTGADAFDTVLDAAIYTKCKAASVGSIDRRYMQTHEGWELWYRECRGASDLRLPMPASRGPFLELVPLSEPRVNPDG